MIITHKDKKIIWRQAEGRLKQDGIQNCTDIRLIDKTNTEDTQNIDKTNEATTKQIIKENDVKYWVDAINDQKTGFYCDQRDNRQLIRSLSEGKTVLDAYCYTGDLSTVKSKDCLQNLFMKLDIHLLLNRIEYVVCFTL